MSKFQNKYRIESNRLKEFDYKLSYWYFVTVCTHNKIKFFGSIKDGRMHLNSYGSILQEEILNTQKLDKADIDYFIIMPNHFHLIIIPSGAATLGTIIGQIKSITLKKIKLVGLEEFRWQSNYYDHIIRNEKDLFRIRNYIELNPLKWELDEYHIP